MTILIGALLTNLGDYISTLIGFYHGCREANPIGRWLFKRHWLAFLIKIPLVSWWLITGGIYLQKVACIIFGLAVINNTFQIIKARRMIKWVAQNKSLSWEEGRVYVKELKKASGKN